MRRLIAADATDARRVGTALRRAMDGDDALALGMLSDAVAEVPAQVAVVIATSGSSGVPKRVALSAAALRCSAEATAARIGAGQWLLALPAGYVAGVQVLVRSQLAGTEPAVLDGRFSPVSFADATLSMLRPAPGGDLPSLYTALVPAQLATLLDAAVDNGSVRAALQAYEAILLGGQALPEPLRERAADVGARLVRTYGSTETSGGCVYDGVPLDGVEVRVFDGELRVTGSTLAEGYLGDDALTAQTFVDDADGVRWYRTGDLGVVEDGAVRVQGRADNVIVSGGINVSLDRVEQVVRDVPGFAQAVVVGVDDEQWGEASVIVVARGEALRRSETDQLVQARETVAAELGKHARPARLVVVEDELPTLSSGKPDRDSIRRLAAELR